MISKVCDGEKKIHREAEGPKGKREKPGTNARLATLADGDAAAVQPTTSIQNVTYGESRCASQSDEI